MAVIVKEDKKILVTPISREDLKDIHIGDIVYLSGDLTTCRDVAHRRVVEEGREIPVDVRDEAILHAGPIIRPHDDGTYEMVSVGPTTSMRMEKFEYEFIKTTGVRVIVGKGGMRENVRNLVRSTAYSLRAMLSSLPKRSRKSSKPSGRIWACRKPSGTAMSKNSAR